MATTKKNTSKKTPGKAAPKRQHAPVEKKQEPVAEQLTDVIPVKPEPVDPSNDIINYEIPLDRSFESTDQYWEGNLNGINYRFRRGEPLAHPRWLYEYVRSKLWAKEHISPFVAEFMNTSKRLNY